MLRFRNKKFERFVSFEIIYLKYNNSAYNIYMQYDFGLLENVLISLTS